MSDKNYCQITIDIFQKYADDNLESKLFWKFIKMDFENWIKKYEDTINSKTWNILKTFCFLSDVWINNYKNYGSWSKILIKFIIATKYNTKFKDWDKNCIK